MMSRWKMKDGGVKDAEMEDGRWKSLTWNIT
jgi:hypothetical protein